METKWSGWKLIWNGIRTKWDVALVLVLPRLQFVLWNALGRCKNEFVDYKFHYINANGNPTVQRSYSSPVRLHNGHFVFITSYFQNGMVGEKFWACSKFWITFPDQARSSRCHTDTKHLPLRHIRSFTVQIRSYTVQARLIIIIRSNCERIWCKGKYNRILHPQLPVLTRLLPDPRIF